MESYPGDARVGVIASGGLSHFLVDEDFDRLILAHGENIETGAKDAIRQTFAFLD